MSHPIERILYQRTEPFLDKIFNSLNEVGVNVLGYELDHICYRTETYPGYIGLKHDLLNFSDLLSENMISKRPIAVLKLHEPIIYGIREIDVLELPAPRDDNMFKVGFEHAEFVLGENTDLEHFIDRYSHLEFNTAGIDRPNNGDISLDFKGHSVKFHQRSLEDVVKSN